MEKCGVCTENLSEGAHCATCEQWLHYQCAGVTKSGYQRLSKDKKLNWRCVKCKPTETAHPPNSPRPESESDPTGTEAVLTEIRALSAKFAPLEGLKEEVLALKKEFLDFKSSMNTQLSDIVNEFRSKINDMEQRIVLMENVQCQVNQLQVRIDKLEEDSNRNEQWLRMNNVELKGVPQSNNENLIDIVTKIGARINYPVSKNLINFISRVPSQQKEHTKPIIVGFCNRYIKEDFIAAARYELKTSPLTVSQLGLSGNQKIFINDHLTPKNKNLLSKAKKTAAEMNFQYVWVKHAKIHVRKSDTTPVIMVKSEKDLTKIV